MRIERERLDQAVFPFSYAMATRYSDTDKLSHVNNVAVGDFLQEGRNRFIHAIELIRKGSRHDMVVGGLYVEYAGELFHPEPVEVFVGVLEIGRSSFRLGEVIRQGGRTAIYAEVVQVAREGGRTAALPEEWREKLERALIAGPAAQA